MTEFAFDLVEVESRDRGEVSLVEHGSPPGVVNSIGILMYASHILPMQHCRHDEDQYPIDNPPGG
jgi:hypothetical protein